MSLSVIISATVNDPYAAYREELSSDKKLMERQIENPVDNEIYMDGPTRITLQLRSWEFNASESESHTSLTLRLYKKESSRIYTFSTTEKNMNRTKVYKE